MNLKFKVQNDRGFDFFWLNGKGRFREEILKAERARKQRNKRRRRHWFMLKRLYVTKVEISYVVMGRYKVKVPKLFQQITRAQLREYNQQQGVEVKTMTMGELTIRHKNNPSKNLYQLVIE